MQRRKGTGFAFALVVGSACAATWTGCTASKQTELVPGVMTQIQVPKDMRAVRIDVQAQGQQSTCQWHSVNPQNPGYVTLPRTLGVVPGAGPDRLVTITVTGYTKDDGDVPVLRDCATPVQGSDGKYDPNVRILRRTRTSYVGDKVLFLPMNLRFSCYDAAQCPPDQTCKGGTCVPADVDPKSLPEYNDGLVSGASNTCFSEKSCFVDQQPAKVIDQTKCIYGFTVPPQSPFGKGVNVRVFYDSDGGESEVLDGDPFEGFTVDPANPQQFQLSAGLCNLVNNPSVPHRIYAVSVASACPTKGLYQPFCNEDIAPGGPVPLPDGGTSADGGCNVSKPLVPAPSALYVVMDDSSSMGKFFGTQGLQTVTSLTLSDPAFRTASVGFKLLPHAAADCSATAPMSSFATPDVPFGSVTAAQPAVAAIVGDPGKVLPNDPTMYVDAALRGSGAYGALRSFATSSGKAYNRLAVLLITNRPAAQDCGIGAPSDLAATALADANPVYTYVVALKNDATPAYDTTELAAIAQKGGTTIFDATTDATIGARAFNAVETDLGSCLYERPDGIDPSAKVSYVDPLSLQTTTVPFDAACSAANATTANGWAFDGANRVRVCGAACSQLRTVLSNTANAFLAQGKSAPDVPITALMSCNAP